MKLRIIVVVLLFFVLLVIGIHAYLVVQNNKEKSMFVGKYEEIQIGFLTVVDGFRKPVAYISSVIDKPDKQGSMGRVLFIRIGLPHEIFEFPKGWIGGIDIGKPPSGTIELGKLPWYIPKIRIKGEPIPFGNEKLIVWVSPTVLTLIGWILLIIVATISAGFAIYYLRQQKVMEAQYLEKYAHLLERYAAYGAGIVQADHRIGKVLYFPESFYLKQKIVERLSETTITTGNKSLSEILCQVLRLACVDKFKANFPNNYRQEIEDKIYNGFNNNDRVIKFGKLGNFEVRLNLNHGNISLKNPHMFEVALENMLYNALKALFLKFSIELEFQRDLDSCTISERLRQAFRNNRIPLSENATVSIEEIASRWQITNGQQKYKVRRENNKLKIYSEENPILELSSKINKHVVELQIIDNAIQDFPDEIENWIDMNPTQIAQEMNKRLKEIDEVLQCDSLKAQDMFSNLPLGIGFFICIDILKGIYNAKIFLERKSNRKGLRIEFRV